jgi:T4-like virus tail tube protein gp19
MATVMNSAFKVKLGQLQFAGVGTVSGLKKSRASKVLHDNAGNTKPRVVVGQSTHENITIKLTAFEFGSGQASELKTMWDNHAKNDDGQDSTSTLSIAFFTDAALTQDAGQYKATGCKIVSLMTSDLDREATEDTATIEVELAVADGDWN